MTIRDLTEFAGDYPLLLIGVFVALPLAALLLGRIHGPDRGGAFPWKYFYSVLVYLACVPGMFSAILIGYALFFTKENLQDVNLLVYVLPWVSMIVTLIFIRKTVSFELIPGFNRLSGLMVMLGCSFAIALAIQKTNIWVFFGGSLEKLFLLAAGVFALLKWGTYMLFRQRNEPVQERPKMPGM